MQSSDNDRIQLGKESNSQIKNKQDWEDIIKKWKLSSLSQMAFCREHNININQFSYQYLKKYKQAESIKKIMPVKIIDQALPVANYFILHYPNGMKLQIPTNIAPDAIKALLNCLESNRC